MSRRLIREIVGPSVMKRVDAVRHELRYGPPAAWSRWHSARETNAKRKKLKRWHDELRASPPDVLAGANLGDHNGITHHIQGIRKHSALRVDIAPPEWLMKDLSHHDLHTTLRDEVMGFAPTGIRAIHSHVYPFFIQWCHRHRDSVSLWVHTYHAYYFPLNPGEELERWQKEYNRVLVEEASHADVRLSVSRWQQKYLAKEHGIETTYLPNGVNVELCDLGDASRFREKYGSNPFILYVGRNEGVKNPADFVRLAQRLREKRFVMIGTGLSVESLRADWGVASPDNLLVIGAATHLEVQDALAACSMLVVTSIREGLPTLVLEAMTHSRSVVAPNEPGCAEAISNGEFGYLYESGNIDDLVSKTLMAVANGPVGSRSRQRVLDEYDWRVVAVRLDAIYRSR